MHRRPVADNLNDVGGAVAWADAIALKKGAPKRVRQDLQVCLEEALANLIMHGRAAGDKKIMVELRARGDGVEARIFDRCTPFDVTDAPLRALDAAQPGGAGLRLLRGLASELRYKRWFGCNVLTLILRESAS